MRALLLAAGLGNRLRPLTNYLPKCLVPIHGRPLLDYWLESLVNGGVSEILINTHYFAPLVRQYLSQSTWLPYITVVHEEILLGTGGTILQNRDFFNDEAFLVAHADNLTIFDVRDFANQHAARPQETELTMMVFEAPDPQSCGIVTLDRQSIVQAFHEKVANPPGTLANAANALKNKDATSTVLFAPINQTGTYTLLVHSTLFDGTEIAEPVSLAAKFTTIVPDDKPPEITFEVPELINKKFDILPEIIEKNPDFVKYYLDGEERELEKLQFGMLPDGEHDLRIHASDIIGNDIDKTFSFTVDNTPPEILIKSPTNGTTVSHSLNIDFKVKDENLAEDGSITILLPNGESLDDITFHSFNVTEIDDGVYDLKIMAVDLAENEQAKMISFNVDHAFVQETSIIPEEKEPSTGNNLLIIISSIIVAIIVISIIVKRIRKTSKENKILKEDL